MKYLDHLEEWIITFLIGGATLIVFTAVVHRYASGLPIPGLQDRLIADPLHVSRVMVRQLSGADELPDRDLEVGRHRPLDQVGPVEPEGGGDRFAHPNLPDELGAEGADDPREERPSQEADDDHHQARLVF